MEGCCGGLAASDENFELHQRVKSAADRLGYDLDYTPGIGGSDHVTFLRRRVPAVMNGAERRWRRSLRWRTRSVRRW